MITGIFNRLGKTKVMVVGDFLLDTYTIGKARRISPEAPVAVIHVEREEIRAGGAGNVVLNLVSLGAEVVTVGRVGNDPMGKCLSSLLQEEGVDIRGLLPQTDLKTPVKNRIVADNQQIVRVDHEETTPIPHLLEQQLIDKLPELLEGVKVVAISDYGKGVASRRLLASVMELASLRGIPVIADPKGTDFTKYNGATLLKPNRGEAFASANLPSDAPLEEVAAKILQASHVSHLMITRSESGISLFDRQGTREDFPARVREVKDVTGAGDTVLATMSYALGCGLELPAAVQLSNVAAGIAVEKFGCARVTLGEMARRLLEEDVKHKIFDEAHLFALQEVLKERPFILLTIDDFEGLTPRLFHAIRELGKRPDCDLLLYLRGETTDDSIAMLASLHDVNFLVRDGHSLRTLCSLIEPAEAYLFVDHKLQLLADHALLF